MDHALLSELTQVYSSIAFFFQKRTHTLSRFDVPLFESSLVCNIRQLFI